MLKLLGRGGTDSRVAMVSGIRTQVAEAVDSSEARGRTSAVVELGTAADIAGMLRTRSPFTGMRQKSAIRVIGQHSCHATKNLNSELFVAVFCNIP